MRQRLIYSRYRFVRRLWFRYLRLFVYFGFRLWLRKVHNFESLPQKGPAIIISNHTSYYDWAILSAIYNKKYIVFLGKEELLRRRFVSWLMKLNILVYVNTEKPGYSYFKKVIAEIKSGKIIVIYPEGTRSKNGKMIEPKIGFVKLALLTNVPVIPVALKGAYEILPPDRNFPNFRKCEVYIGEKQMINGNNLLFKDIFNNVDSYKDLDDNSLKIIAKRLMNIIAEMAGQEWDG